MTPPLMLMRAAESPIGPTNDSRMCIEHWASTPTVDKAGEIIDASVIDLNKLHRQNPIGLFAHDRRSPWCAISKYLDQDGNYTIKSVPYGNGGNGLYGTAYFSQLNPMGPVVYGLYVERILKQFSIGLFGTKMRNTVRMTDGKVARQIPSAMLFEVSCVPVAENFDATATVIHKGSINGYKIPERMIVMLKGMMPVRSAFMFSPRKTLREIFTKAFDPELHPRERDGKFSDAGALAPRQAHHYSGKHNHHVYSMVGGVVTNTSHHEESLPAGQHDIHVSTSQQRTPLTTGQRTWAKIPNKQPAYIAKITGTGGPYGLQRQFLTGRNLGNHKVRVGEGVYEVRAVGSEGQAATHFFKIENGEHKPMNRSDVNSHFQNKTTTKAMRKPSLRSLMPAA